MCPYVGVPRHLLQLHVSRAALAGCLLLAACAGPKSDEGTGADEAAASELVLQGSFVETTKEAFGPQPCGPGLSEGCYSNDVVVCDLNGDGNLDVVFANGGGHFVPRNAEKSVVYFGDGKGAFTDGASAFADPILPSRVRQVVVGDINGDGLLDLYLPGGFGLDDDQLFMSSKTGFKNEASTRLPSGSRRSRAGGAHLGDLDNDGDLDLVVIDWGPQPNPDVPGVSPVTVKLLINDGRGVFTLRRTLDAPDGSSATDVDLQDLDGDFDLDIVVTNRNGQSRLFLNQGGSFTDVTVSKAFPPKRGKFSFNAEACDVDGDGHLDLLFEGAASNVPGHDTQLLMNDGTGTFTDQTELRIKLEPMTDDNQVKCADVDNDGHFDLLVGSLGNRGEKLFINNGKGFFTEAKNKVPAIIDPTLAVGVGDFDGDGRVDFVTAQGENPSLPFLNRVYKNNLTVKRDVNAPVFRRVETPVAAAGRPTVLRLAVTDAQTSETGQQVKQVSVSVTVDQKPATEIAAQFSGGDVFRAVIPPQRAGAVLTVTPIAVDRQGNTATHVRQRIVVAP